MNRRTLFYTALLIVPVVALGFFGLRAAASEKKGWHSELADLYGRNIDTMEKDINTVLSDIEKKILGFSFLLDADTAQLRESVRKTAFLRQLFRLDTDGALDFPPLAGQSAEEAAFLVRTSGLWQTGQRFSFPDEQGSFQERGWFRYYEANAVAFLFWIRDNDGRVLGFDVYREFILSAVLNMLARNDYIDRQDPDKKMILYDELGRMVFSSGSLPVEGKKAFLSRQVAGTLGGWRTDLFLSSAVFSAGGPGVAVPAALAAVMIALLIGAFLFWKEYTREIRDAGRKVSFVNQVSHELKTPLTNIRMYAEMLTGRLGPKSREKKYADILCQESERLSRLINNVLNFSGKSGQPHFSEIHPGERVKNVVAMYRTRLDKNGLRIVHSAGKDGKGFFDIDILEQICWNLINNAEKYAGTGKLEIWTGFENGCFSADFIDDGPGIHGRNRERVFEPFYRVRSDLTEGVSGSGLGLAISRMLARKHGGDIELIDRKNGAHFRLVLTAGGKNANTDS
ncbi:MAG: HAMP domain-containing histidine kinase [Spirochaetales bacterium]|nr:HAMP domain-containing histidine kinase [Spirochaetales bacterium]